MKSLFRISCLTTTTLLLCSLAKPVKANDDLCLLCKAGIYDLKYPNTVVKSDGSTCTDLSLNLALEYTPGSSSCSQQIQAWRQICCSGEEPDEVEYTEVLDDFPDVDSIQTLGDYPKCNVCRDGDYPSESSMVINMLYIGAGTCTQYWKVGQQGLIPTHLCDPLQFFAYEPCGCGEFNQNLNGNSGNSGNGGNSGSGNGNSYSNSGQFPTTSDSSSSGTGGSDVWWSNADSLGSNDGADANAGGDWWSKADSSSATSEPALVGIVALTFGLSMLLLVA